MLNQIYVSLWNKYRPAIIQLMVASHEGPRQYKLYVHEFKALNSKERSYSFELRAFKGKALNRSKTTANALDLLTVLNDSKKATELMNENEFDISLDKQFVLHVARVEPS
jgi:hypothetical protein